jgi:hypothetical protein
MNHGFSRVAPHLIVDGSLPGNKREYETDEINEPNEKILDFFVCFVTFRMFRILLLPPISHTTVNCLSLPQSFHLRALSSAA